MTTKTARHTPGPWMVSDTGTHIVGPGCMVATIEVPNHPRPLDWGANARLIAAAPAMLDALIYAVNYCDEEGSGVPTAWEDLAQILRAVISIARGR